MHPSRDSKILRTTLILFFLAAIAYGGYEAHGMVLGPSITVPVPVFGTSSPFAAIEGATERISELRLNGTRVTVTESGAFRESFLLSPGTNHFVLEARDSRGRRATERVAVLYTPDESQLTQTLGTSTPANIPEGGTTEPEPVPETASPATTSATGTREE